MRYIIIFLITFYQKAISPLSGSSCRFYPTCSQYSKEAFLKYGISKGFLFTLKRILKCHPFNPGGYDPVPLKNSNKKMSIELWIKKQ